MNISVMRSMSTSFIDSLSALNSSDIHTSGWISWVQRVTSQFNGIYGKSVMITVMKLTILWAYLVMVGKSVLVAWRYRINR
jgi:hypothetical protein